MEKKFNQELRDETGLASIKFYVLGQRIQWTRIAWKWWKHNQSSNVLGIDREEVTRTTKEKMYECGWGVSKKDMSNWLEEYNSWSVNVMWNCDGAENSCRVDYARKERERDV